MLKPENRGAKELSINQLNLLFCNKLQGVGPVISRALSRLGINSVLDLLLHFPTRYEDKTTCTALHAVEDGTHALIEGMLTQCSIQPGRRRQLLLSVSVDNIPLTIRFFQFYLDLPKRFNHHLGQRIRCYGLIRRFGSRLEMAHPEFWLLDDTNPLPHFETLTPVYPSTDGMSQNLWRRLMTQALTLLEKCSDAYHLNTLLMRSGLFQEEIAWCTYDFRQALAYVHAPPKSADLKALCMRTHPVWQRLAFEELLAQHLSLHRFKGAAQTGTAPVLAFSAIDSAEFEMLFPFSLTAAQKRVCHEIANDLNRVTPMLRLVQGDVGSGKTVVAAFAVAAVIRNGFQVALMAPTELLAEQHANTFKQWFGTTPNNKKSFTAEIVLLTGKLSRQQQTEVRNNIQNGQAQIIIGTHALFQKDVEFARLGLVIIDEQHRFGVEQRLALRKKSLASGYVPHQLIMTATPIPRTLAMTVYSDLDCSTIDELPPQRKPITTVVINNQRRSDVIERIQKVCQNKAQVYWVCVLIEEQEENACKAAFATVAELQQALAEINIGLIHGRLKAEEKQQVMEAFKEGTIQVLVATTVIEVGVDVPNASLMIIENAERLGLAQLHQLRGRVGRGDKESFCVLLYEPPLSSFAKERLSAIRDNHDGFLLAQKDLELRGPGEMFGVRQAGLCQMSAADLIRDQELFPHIAKAAQYLLQHDLKLIDQLINRWLTQQMEFAGV